MTLALGGVAWWLRRVGDHGARKSRCPAPHAATEKATRKKARIRRRRASARQARSARRHPGMVETALAAFAHEVRTPLTGILAISDLLATSDLDERERRWVDTIKAGAEHLAEPRDAVCRCRTKRRSRACRLRQDFFDLRALARNVGDSLAGRAAAKGLHVVGRDFRKAAGLRDRRSRSAARGAGKPDRQCGQVHRAGSVALRVTPLREHQGQGRRRLCGLRQRHRPYARRDQAPVPAVLAGQCLHRVALRRRRARTVVGQAAGAGDGRRHRRRAAARGRHHVHVDRDADAGGGSGESRIQAPMAICR